MQKTRDSWEVLRMYISKVSIENYRGFSSFNVDLSKVTVVVGENESGKSNFFSALALPLSNNNISFNQKRLNVSDINARCILAFYSAIINKQTEAEIRSKIPVVNIDIELRDPKDEYEETLLKNWLCEDGGGALYGVRYRFAPKNTDDLIAATRALLNDTPNISDARWFTLPVELYEYEITSTNNGKQISFSELKRLVMNAISAERDDFSQSATMKANSLLTRMLVNTLKPGEKATINQAYISFFKSIEGTEIFDQLIKLDPEFENFKDHIEDVECIPNLPDLRNILSNITLKSGDMFLYQKGLGERNLLYILILFEFYKKDQKYFNLCCIEEPEAHLSVNNLRLAIDFIYKSTNAAGGLLQTIISSHNPSVINKLELSNVVVFSGDKAISLKNSAKELQDYLRKRPNFDILKLLFADKLILVEGPTEEMLINAALQSSLEVLSIVEIISIGQKGFRTFLDAWLDVNKGNGDKKIAIVRDFDDQEQAKIDHDQYDQDHDNIRVRTTAGYTLEDDLVAIGDNLSILRNLFDLEDKSEDEIITYMKDSKTQAMLTLCDAMITEKDPISIALPEHIQQVINFVS